MSSHYIREIDKEERYRQELWKEAQAAAEFYQVPSTFIDAYCRKYVDRRLEDRQALLDRSSRVNLSQWLRENQAALSQVKLDVDKLATTVEMSKAAIGAYVIECLEELRGEFQ